MYNFLNEFINYKINIKSNLIIKIKFIYSRIILIKHIF